MSLEIDPWVREALRCPVTGARLVDGTVNGVGAAAGSLSEGLRLAQSGHVQRAALVMAAGVLAALALAVVFL